MNWKELKKNAKEMGYSINEAGFEYVWKYLKKGEQDLWITFYKGGDVRLDFDSRCISTSFCLAKKRTTLQMLMIMRGLE